jgi:Ca2+-binding RTX toxin-like protein
VLSGIENLAGGSGADTIQGDGGTNVLSGGAGADTLRGGAGDDTLRGGSGADSLAGGDGADRFVFGAEAIGSADVISDFATGDVLDLSQLLAALGGTPVAAGEHVAFVQSGTAVQVRLDQNGAAAGNTDTLVATIANQSAAQVQAQTNFG